MLRKYSYSVTFSLASHKLSLNPRRERPSLTFWYWRIGPVSGRNQGNYDFLGLANPLCLFCSCKAGLKVCRARCRIFYRGCDRVDHTRLKQGLQYHMFLGLFLEILCLAVTDIQSLLFSAGRANN